MSTQRPDWWPVYGDPLRCPISGATCVRFECVMAAGMKCEERNKLALVPMEPKAEAK